MEFKKAFISELKPARYNPRKDLQPSDPEYQRIKKSIEEFGYVDPVIVNSDYTVIGGHQRLKVLKELGHAQIDVVVVDIPKNREKALNVALNKISGEWDTQRLTDLLGEIKADGLLELTGFDEKEFDQMLRELHKDDEPQDSEPQISRAEDLRKEWGTELGQLWQCGSHRVLCGDCTELTNVNKLMGGEKADMVFTDPPYNCAGESKNFAADCSTSMNNLKNSEWDKNFDPEKALDIILKNISENATVYICTSHFLAPKIWEWMRTWASHFSWCAWHKSNPMPSLAKRHWTWDGELIPYATRGKHVFNFPQTGHAPSIWCLPKEKETQHPTEKPVGVPAMGISHSSNEGGIILDPFLGSGTTMIACENLGRKCRGMEIDPGYVAVILQRYKDTFPGKEIRLVQE